MRDAGYKMQDARYMMQDAGRRSRFQAGLLVEFLEPNALSLGPSALDT